MHYASFFGEAAEDPLAAFVARERARQERLRNAIGPERRAELAPSLAVLQFCDNLSLFICRSPPGRSAVADYRDGLPWAGGRIAARWEGPERIALEPSPLIREADLWLPFRETPGPDAPSRPGIQHVRVR